MDIAERGAEAEADAIEEKDADERLAEVARQRQSAGSGQDGEDAGVGPSLIDEADGGDIREGHGDDADGIEQRVDGETPGVAADDAPSIDEREGQGNGE